MNHPHSILLAAVEVEPKARISWLPAGVPINRWRRRWAWVGVLFGTLLANFQTTSTAAELPAIATEQIFGPETSTGPYKHPSTITELDNGDLLLAYYGGAGEYAKETTVFGSRLKRGETKWSAPVPIASNPFYSMGNPVLWQAPDSRLWLFYVVRPGSTWSTSRTAAKVSKDRGLSWSDAFIVAWDAGMMVRSRPILLADGTYLLPVYHETGSDPERTAPDTSSVFLRFDPATSTWTESNRVRSRMGNLQAAVVELSPGNLFALARRGGDYASAIPNYDAVIFDEAHQLEDIATEFFGVRLSEAKADALLRDAWRTLLNMAKPSRASTSAKNSPKASANSAHHDGTQLDLAKTPAESLDASALNAAEEARVTLFESLAVTFRNIERREAGSSRESRRVVRASDFDQPLRAAMRAFDHAINLVRMRAETRVKDDAASIIARRADEMNDDLRQICLACDVDPRGDVPFDGPHFEPDASELEASRGPIDGDSRVVWIELRDRSVGIGSSPISLGPILRSRIFERIGAVVCTSATP